MYKLLTWGYQSRSIESLVALIKEHQIGLVADVRTTPWSRYQADFIEKALRDRLGSYLLDGRYAYYGEDLGNAHRALPWRRQANWKKGVNQIAALLQYNAILLLCLERDPANCHRSEVAQEIQSVCGCEVIHLGWPPESKGQKKAKKAKKKQKDQLTLF